MTDPENEAAVNSLADEINRREGELVVLRQAFELLGGTFEDDEPAAKQKLLTGPKQKKQRRKKTKKAPAMEPDEFGVTIAGQFVKLRERQAAVVELLMAANGAPVSKASINEAWGSACNFQATFNSINKKLAGVGLVAVQVRGEGYQLQPV